MALDHPRLLASVTALLIGIPACTTAPPEETIAAGIEMVEPETGATIVESAMSQDPQQQSLQEQRRRALVRKYLSDAAELRAGGDLDAALLQAMKARDLEPANWVQLLLAPSIYGWGARRTRSSVFVRR